MTTTSPIINVDAIVAPELREEAAAMVADLEAFGPQFRELMARAIDTYFRIYNNNETRAITELEEISRRHGTMCDAGTLIAVFTGSQAFYDAFDPFGGFESVAEAVGRSANTGEEVSK